MDKTIRHSSKIVYLLKGLFIAYIITAIILLILSLLMLKLNLPSIVTSVGINLAYIASSLLSGFYVGKKVEQKKFIWGLLMGVVYFVILMLVSLIMNQSSPLPLGNMFTVLVICSLSGMLGGMLS